MTASLGVVLPPDLPTELFLPYVRMAEALGFREIWMIEDCFLRGGLTQAAVVLASTERIHVGIGILPAGARNVAFASMEIATLAELFPGRLTVGIGHGMPDWMRQVGEWPTSPLGLLEEYLAALTALLGGEEVTVDGRYVTLDRVRLARPPRIVPRVFAGVRGPKSLAVSGRAAAGTLLAEPVTPEYLAEARRSIGARASHEIAAYAIAAVAETATAARAAARESMLWIGEPGWAPHIDPLPFAGEFRELRAGAASREAFAASLPDEWVDQLGVVGTVDQARARLGDLASAGADRIILSPAGADPMAMLQALGDLL